MDAISQRIQGMRDILFVITAAFWLSSPVARAAALATDMIYDSNPNHLWNRLNKTLFERTAKDGAHYGLNEMDILYWSNTTNLLAGPSHEQAVSVLDEFINSHGEKLIQDPLKKALLQHDLWTLFDWACLEQNLNHAAARMELQKRLAVAIRRLELTTNEIASLPDNYALAQENHMADLPQGMFSMNSNWITVGINGGEPAVPAHVNGFGGRSVFIVLFHDADGRQAGENYLNQLKAFKPMFIFSTNSNFPNGAGFNPALPQFPIHSQWALLRRMCVIDTDGQIQATPIVKSVQVRTYLALDSFNGNPESATNLPQRAQEFRMMRNAQAKLVSIGKDELDFTSNNNFFSLGIDPFESRGRSTPNDKPVEYRAVVLNSCVSCHNGPGILSVNTFTRTFSSPSTFQPTQLSDLSPEREVQVTRDWKESRFDWGLLQGLWMQQN